MSTSKKSGGFSKCCDPCGCYKTNASGTKKTSKILSRYKSKKTCTILTGTIEALVKLTGWYTVDGIPYPHFQAEDPYILPIYNNSGIPIECMPLIDQTLAYEYKKDIDEELITKARVWINNCLNATVNTANGPVSAPCNRAFYLDPVTNVYERNPNWINGFEAPYTDISASIPFSAEICYNKCDCKK